MNLEYNPDTGDFTRDGRVAGSVYKNGYRYIGVNGKRYRAHRLAFLFMEGEFPPNDVDHINRKKDDNRWVNLRHATKQQNAKNIKASGYAWEERTQRWRVKTQINGKQKHVGRFKTKLGASYAYHVANLGVW